MEELSDQFDASRSTGHLCAATVENFEQVSLLEESSKCYWSCLIVNFGFEHSAIFYTGAG